MVPSKFCAKFSATSCACPPEQCLFDAGRTPGSSTLGVVGVAHRDAAGSPTSSARFNNVADEVGRARWLMPAAQTSDVSDDVGECRFDTSSTPGSSTLGEVERVRHPWVATQTFDVSDDVGGVSNEVGRVRHPWVATQTSDVSSRLSPCRSGLCDPLFCMCECSSETRNQFEAICDRRVRFDPSVEGISQKVTIGPCGDRHAVDSHDPHAPKEVRYQHAPEVRHAARTNFLKYHRRF